MVGEGSLRVGVPSETTTEFGGKYLNGCQSRTVLMDTHLDGDTHLGNLRTELVDLEMELCQTYTPLIHYAHGPGPS